MPTPKSQAKTEIKKLLEKYERVKKSRQIKKYDEANTRKDFIMPLFKALGWDVYNDFTDREVVEEETAIKGRVDYSFRINNIPQFLLEAKALKVDLDKLEWAKQAVSYGWNKGIPWVVLTDFEGLKLFNSEWPLDIPRPNLEFSCDEFLSRLDDLWLLSKPSIEKGELDRQAEKWGIKAKRPKVSEKLAADLLSWREILRKYFSRYNPKIDASDIDESVQRVLDRLIFIRVCEDRQLEPPTLWPALQKWIANYRKPDNFMQALKPIFKDFDHKYNSNLFLEHLCEKLDTEGTPFEQIINDLYADKERGVKYNFAAIDADVLGAIYEQYLGFVQKKGLVNDSKRKKQGIYYTPSYIVDYIVQNTLGVVLKEKPLQEIENLKILDPACGSGSFLIKAFDLLDEELAKRKAQEKSGPRAAFRKFNILRNNVYGVDLDPQAIEIARLNLLLKALEPKHKLPLLNNTKVGNSLISGTEEKLKRYFGKKWEEKKPFNWNEEFLEVFEKGGFDVIIGNPPYIQLSMERNLTSGLKKYLIQIYGSSMGRLNTFGFFIKRSIGLLREGGYLGFITPNTFLTQDYYEELRSMILDNCVIKSIVSFESLPFKDAVVENVILVLQKTKSKSKRMDNKVQIREIDGKLDFSKEAKWFPQLYYFRTRKKIFNLNFDERKLALKEKIENASKKLGQFLEVNQAIALKHSRERWITKERKGGNLKPLLVGGKNIGRYSLNWDGTYLKYDPKGIHSCKRQDIFLSKEKIFFRRVADRLIATLDTQKFYGLHTLVVMNSKKDNPFDLRYFLALFNSTLASFYYNLVLASTKTVFSEIGARQVKELPIKLINESVPSEKKRYGLIIKLADRMLELNKNLQKCTKDSDKYRAIQAKIQKTDKQIDQLVYKLYNLTAEEIKTIEGSKR